MRKLIISGIIVICNYLLLTVLSFYFTSNLDMSFIGKWGLLAGFILFIGALPLFKVTYFGGRGMAGFQTPEIPPDEHLQHKAHQKYEKSNKNTKQDNKAEMSQDVFMISGLIIIIIAIFLVSFV